MKAYTYDDVLIQPEYSDISSRSEISLEQKFLGFDLKLPIIPANMDYITGYDMYKTAFELGCFAILNRFDPIYQTIDYIDSLLMNGYPISISVGTKEGYDGVSKYLAPFGIDKIKNDTIITVDVAHGHHQNVISLVKQLKDAGFPKVIAGNVATRKGYGALASAGADAIKVGIGPGAVCTTREVTGVGVPQLFALMECAAEQQEFGGPPIIADGGIKSSGDIVKALVAADMVMIGSLLAGTDECPGEVRVAPDNSRWRPYRGQSIFGTNGTKYAPEGIEGWVKEKGPVADVLRKLAGGIRSGFSYVGARNITEFQAKAEFIEVSTGTQVETSTRVPVGF